MSQNDLIRGVAHLEQTDRWAFARELWTDSFAPLVDAGFVLERPSEDDYWPTHEKELREHFPPETIISLERLRTTEEKARQARLEKVREDNRLRDFCFVREDGRLAAVFCGEQKDSSTYRMWHSNVHPDFRRRGIYGLILRGTVSYTAALGFDRITSEHAPGNNAILIAKLKAGFRITGMEVDPGVGTSIVVTYFHNADHLAAYEFRCGLATVNERILAESYGAMSQLAAQFSRTPSTNDDS